MTDHQATALLNHWPDGTPKSFGNAFTGHYDGQRSCMLSKSEIAHEALKIKRDLAPHLKAFQAKWAGYGRSGAVQS